MQEKSGTFIFVTIGVPFSKIPIMQKVMMYVEHGETAVRVAKGLRKQVADNIENHGWVPGTNFTPAELYWEAYVGVNNERPHIASSNSPVFANGGLIPTHVVQDELK